MVSALQLSEQRHWMWAAIQGRAKELGLSAMAACILGKPLNKAMQTSLWRQRPLSPAQLHYAALDAHVSLQLYNTVMHHITQEEQVEVQALVR